MGELDSPEKTRKALKAEQARALKQMKADMVRDEELRSMPEQRENAIALTLPVGYGNEILVRYDIDIGVPFIGLSIVKEGFEGQAATVLLTMNGAEMLGNFLVNLSKIRGNNG